MQLLLTEQMLHLEMEWYEQFLAFHFHNPIKIPLAHITSTSIAEPVSSWKEVRAPGTCIPGVIKAGTYYSDRGAEFWYVTQSHHYLTLELKEEFFKRIILTLDGNEAWASRINDLIASH